MFGRVKIDLADRLFSLYIRYRDNWTCQWCWKYDPPQLGDPSGLQNSHFFGRGMESVRFDEENCVTLCAACHQYWGSTNREDYRAFKIRQLGQRRFDLLTLRAHTRAEKDRKLVIIYYREKLRQMGARI